MSADRDTAAPRRRRIEACGTELEIHEWGEPGRPAILLAHGIQDFALTLAPVAEAFALDHHVIAYDLRGHGDSAHPGIYTMTHHIADLHAVFTDSGVDRPIVVGHSLGGQVVAQWAGIFAELPRAIVLIEGLGPPYAQNRFPEEVRQKRARMAVEALDHPRKHRLVASFDHAWDLLKRVHPRLDPARARIFVKQGTRPLANGGLEWKWDPQVVMTWMSNVPEAAEERWSWVTCPALILTAALANEFWSGRRGVDVQHATPEPAEIARRVALFRSGEHEEIADAGHMVHYDAPKQLVESLRGFMERLPPDNRAGGAPPLVRSS